MQLSIKNHVGMCIFIIVFHISATFSVISCTVCVDFIHKTNYLLLLLFHCPGLLFCPTAHRIELAEYFLCIFIG